MSGFFSGFSSKAALQLPCVAFLLHSSVTEPCWEGEGAAQRLLCALVSSVSQGWAGRRRRSRWLSWCVVTASCRNRITP